MQVSEDKEKSDHQKENSKVNMQNDTSLVAEIEAAESKSENKNAQYSVNEDKSESNEKTKKMV